MRFRDVGRDLDGVRGGAGRVFGVGARAHPHYAVAGPEGVRVAGTCGDDVAFGFAAEDFGFGRWVETCSEVAILGGDGLVVEDEWRGEELRMGEIRVDVVDADVVVFN